MSQQESGFVGSSSELIGRIVLGSYRVEKRLGEGGMGEVFLLRHQRLPNTFAALKVMRVDEISGPEVQARMNERFEQEAMVAAAVGSHRVVKPLDIGRFEDGALYIVMEYVGLTWQV